MQNALRIAAALLVCALAVPAILRSQEPSKAPVPPGIAAGKKVFVSNRGGIAIPDSPDLVYGDFYSRMKSWGQYELVADPSEADLVFEISFAPPTTTAVVTNTNGTSWPDYNLQLVVMDAKSHFVLWTLTEPVERAIRGATWRKNIDDAMNALVMKLRSLAARSAAGSAMAK